jgi:hypothetical protein
MKIIVLLNFLFLSNILIAQTGKSKFKYVTLNTIPRPKAPANLIIYDVSFNDDEGNKNKILDAEENAEIKFTIENKGQGDAYAIFAQIEDGKKVKGTQIPSNYKIGDLLAGAKKNIIIPIRGLQELETSSPDLNIKVFEGNNFDADPLSISFKSLELKKPNFKIDDFVFANKDQEGKITKGKVIQLSIVLHNNGEGDAKNINVNFGNPNNIFPASETNFNLPILKANEVRKVDYEFFANKQYNDTEIPITIKVTESLNRYTLSETKSISLESTLAKAQRVDVVGKEEEKASYEKISLISDVDRNIPESKIKYENKFALIIGNEDYSSFQTDLSKEVNVEFALNDAKVFREYCEKTFGVPSINITYIPNGTYGKIKQAVEKINKLIKNSQGNLDIFFYYAGHGLPDEQTKEPYIIPVDVSSSNVENGIKLKDIYSSLTEFPTHSVTIFVDACFSGGARNQELVMARGVKVVPKYDLLKGNIVSFSASSGNQSSYSYASKNHGMFTYFLLKSIQESNGDITYGDMWEKVKNKVSFESVKINSKEQNPQKNIGLEVENEWSKWKFKY